MDRAHDIRSLFFQFVKFGCFTFGGGWSIVAQIRKVYVEQHQSIGDEELLDLTSVARSLPGTMIGNIAMMFGYRQAGLAGGIACVFGLTLPPMAILMAITLFYAAFRDSYWVAAAMSGIRAAVAPIILCAAFPMMKTTFGKSRRIVMTAAIAALAFCAYQMGIGCGWIVVLGALGGAVIHCTQPKGGDDR